MKILVTGSSGFVGKHLIQKLSEKHEIIKYDLIDGQDVLDEKLLFQKLQGVDLVIHLAAFISAIESWGKTLESIVSQDYGNFEVIIMDGGSSDGTLKIIKEYAKK